MAGLALSHGNADSERGFSANKKVVTADRARLCEGTVNAVHLVKDVIRCHGKLSTNVSITPAVVRRAQGAYSKYKVHLEEEQRIKEMRKNNYWNANNGNWKRKRRRREERIKTSGI